MKDKIEAEDLIKQAETVIFKLNGKLNYINGIEEWITKILYNPTFFDKCDQNIYLLGFNNGVFDTETKNFRKGKPDDYITKSVGYDFPTEATHYKNDIENFF